MQSLGWAAVWLLSRRYTILLSAYWRIRIRRPLMFPRHSGESSGESNLTGIRGLPSLSDMPHPHRREEGGERNLALSRSVAVQCGSRLDLEIITTRPRTKHLTGRRELTLSGNLPRGNSNAGAAKAGGVKHCCSRPQICRSLDVTKNRPAAEKTTHFIRPHGSRNLGASHR